MSKAVKAAGLGLVVFVTVWAVTLWRWHRSQAPVGSEEAVEQLLLLPAGIALLACLVWVAATRLRAWTTRPVASQVVSPPPVPAKPGEPAVAASAQASASVLSILAEAVSLPHAEAPDAAWSMLSSSALRPGLDPLLRDADGWPVFASRMSELDTQDWLAAHADLVDAELPEGVLRALALLEGPWHELLASLPSIGRGLAGDPAQGAHHIEGADRIQCAGGPNFLAGVGRPGAAAQEARHRERAAALDIHVCLPAGWSERHRDKALAWLRQQAGPALDWTRSTGAGEPGWSVQFLNAPEEAWDAWSRTLLHVAAEPRPRASLLVAAHSLIDEVAVAAMQARGELFTGAHQGGRVPGEGAAGLLLANRALLESLPPEAMAASPWLGAPVAAHRQRSADRAGRPGADELAHAIRQALLSAASEPETTQAWWCVGDADHRPGRVGELFEAFQTLQPDGDASLGVHRVGDAWGELGVVRALAPLALAASALRHGQAPLQARQAAVVVTLSQCAHRRWAIPVWPASRPAQSPIAHADPAEPRAA
jgi:hypothetical protein